MAFSAGIISIGTTLYPISEIEVPRGPQMIVLVTDPRFPSPGMMEGIFKIINQESISNKFVRCRAVALPWRNLVNIKVGESVIVQAKFMPISLPLNPFAYDATQRRHGVSLACKISQATRSQEIFINYLSSLRRSVRQAMSERFGVGEVPGLFLSMVLGSRDTISSKTAHAFQVTGLAHLLVVSGFHITLIFSSILYLCRLGARKMFLMQPDLLSVSFALACGFALVFVAFIGVDGASLRAGVAVVVVFISKLTERGGGLLHHILVALFVVAVIWPGCYFEPGIELTFAALMGIAYGLGLRTPSARVRMVAIAIFPSLTTLGIVILWFGMFSPASFILNPILAAPVSFIVTVGGLISLLLFLLGLDSSGILVSGILWMLDYFRALIWYCAEIPYAAVIVEGKTQYIIGALALLLVIVLWLERGFRNAIGYGIISVGKNPKK